MKAFLLVLTLGLLAIAQPEYSQAAGKKPANMSEESSDIAYLYVQPGPAEASVNGHASLLVGNTVYNPK